MALSYHLTQLGSAHIAICQMPEAKSVTMGVWFNVGSRYENTKQNGVAHFIEHMLFKGTARYSSKKISELIEGRGGDLNAFTSEENTCYYARMEARHLPLLIDVLIDMVQASTFAPAEFAKERSVILEEIRMYDDMPSSVASDALNRLLWPNHSLGRPILGTLQSVENLSRSDLFNFWKKRYQNPLISFAGAINRQEVEKLLKQKLKSGRASLQKSEAFKNKPSPNIAALKRPVQQTNVAIGIKTFSRHDKRRYALRLLNTVLGENMSSRLFQTIRERHGLAYSIHTSLNHFCDTGAFSIQAGLEASALEKMFLLTGKEITRLREKKISSPELRRAKDYCIGQLQLSLESSMSQMMWMGETFMGYGRLIDPQITIASIEAVQAEEINQVARQFLQPQQMSVVCVGPDITDSILKSAAKKLLA